MAYAPYRNKKTGRMSLRYVAPRHGTVAPRNTAGQFNRRVILDKNGKPVFHLTKGPR